MLQLTSIARLVPTIFHWSTKSQKISVRCCTRRLIYHSSYLQVLVQMLFTAYSLIIRLKLLPQAHHKPWGLVVGKDIVRLTSFAVESIISHDVYLLTTTLVLVGSKSPLPHLQVWIAETATRSIKTCTDVHQKNTTGNTLIITYLKSQFLVT